MPVLILMLLRIAARGADADKDTLLFHNGEKLIGRLLRSGGSTLTFRSDSAGDVTAPWSTVKELQTASRFAVVEKHVRLGRREDPARIPQGRISASSGAITVEPAGDVPPTRIAIGDAGHLIDERTFRRAARDPGLLQGWRGTITAGASLVEATQDRRTFTGAISLTRPIPAEAWLPARNRSTFDFTGVYGTVSQPSTPRLKTGIYHLGIEHDVYFTSRFFAFGRTAWDHNFSQGLDLQQSYGAGIGWTTWKSPAGALDLKASLNYLNQQFKAPQVNQGLIGATFAETLQRRLWNGITLSQQISVTPTPNNFENYAAQGSLHLTVPVYKRVSFTVGALDSFLNNPTPGFRKNSFQFTTGLSYTLAAR